MSTRTLVLLALVMALLGTLANLPQRVAQAAARPDVVVFYLDDLAAYPMRLWADPSVTPNLARFAKQGMRFERAVASTPLCGPARANLLTGQYGHNSGVTQNHVGPFDQRGTLSPKLRARRLQDRLHRQVHQSPRAGLPHAREDVEPGQGLEPLRDHVGRAGGVLRLAPVPQERDLALRLGTDRPLLLPGSETCRPPHRRYAGEQAALHDGIALRRPRPDHAHGALQGPSRLCRGRWLGRPGVQRSGPLRQAALRPCPPLRSQPSYALRERCEALLTIDWVVGEVQRALSAAGRSWNTLQIVTADNGWLMGDHRLVGKGVPYSARVPLFMRWPAVMGNQLRIVREPVSNVDLAPTICALAGCAMPKADGINIVPLIKHTRSWMGRDFVWTELLHNDIHWTKSPKARPGWAGLETTRRYSKTPWAYAQATAPARRSCTTSRRTRTACGTSRASRHTPTGSRTCAACGGRSGTATESAGSRARRSSCEAPEPRGTQEPCALAQAAADYDGSMGSEGACSRRASSTNGRANALMTPETR